MSAEWITRFVDALHNLEDAGDVEPLVREFSPDGALWNVVQPEPQRGTERIRKFWRQYRDQFTGIHSTFDRIIEAGDEAALEWRAEGALRPGGKPVRYRGVTLLKRDPQGIVEFAGYYDPRPFMKALQGVPEKAPAAADAGFTEAGPEAELAEEWRSHESFDAFAASEEEDRDQELDEGHRSTGSLMNYQ